jgi:hypothetical protein
VLNPSCLATLTEPYPILPRIPVCDVYSTYASTTLALADVLGSLALRQCKCAPSAQVHNPFPLSLSSAQLDRHSHGTYVSCNCCILGVTLPSHLPRCPEIIPKADEERSSHTPACLSVAIVRVNNCHPFYPSRSSSRIGQIPHWRREINEVVVSNSERPLCVFCRHLWGRQPGKSRLLR